jgi:hypothetical protein
MNFFSWDFQSEKKNPWPTRTNIKQKIPIRNADARLRLQPDTNKSVKYENRSYEEYGFSALEHCVGTSPFAGLKSKPRENQQK